MSNPLQLIASLLAKLTEIAANQAIIIGNQEKEMATIADVQTALAALQASNEALISAFNTERAAVATAAATQQAADQAQLDGVVSQLVALKATTDDAVSASAAAASAAAAPVTTAPAL